MKVLCFELALAVAICDGGSAVCQKMEYAQATLQEDIYIPRIQDYINGIRTLQARLAQVVTFKDGTQRSSAGHCWLDKTPRSKGGQDCKIRVTSPGWESIIKDGILYNCNLEKKKISKNGISSSPLAPLFSNRLDIRKQFGLHVVALDRPRSFVSITLKTAERSSTSVTLFFSLYENGNICALVGWMIIDASGTTTQVMFEHASIKANAPLPSDTFDLPSFR